jgi:hypothetical protein
MQHAQERGSPVIVRTFRGFPCIRKLWLAGPVACVVAEDAAFDRLLRGDTSGAVYVPAEDVFVFDPRVAARLDPKKPFREWDRLRRYERQAAAPAG